MNLRIIGSSSSGNCYILEAKNKEIFILEAGVNISEIKKGINFNMRNVSGAFVSHEHGDHAKSVKDLDRLGIKVLTSSYIVDTKCLIHGERAKSHQIYRYGTFSVLPFQVEHDAEQTFGCIINHHESGPIVFVTDTYMFRYELEENCHWLIEANYSEKNPVEHRIVNSHMSLEEAIKVLKRNAEPKSVTLIHLSDRNSNSKVFKEEVAKHIGIIPTIADKKIEIELCN